MNDTRSFVAVAAGFAVSAFLVMIYQLVLAVVVVRGDRSIADRYAKGEIVVPSNRVLVLTIGLDALCAAVGGLVTSCVTRERNRRNMTILAGIFFIGCLASIVSESNNGIPSWVASARAVLSPLAILLLSRIVPNKPAVDPETEPKQTV